MFTALGMLIILCSVSWDLAQISSACFTLGLGQLFKQFLRNAPFLYQHASPAPSPPFQLKEGKATTSFASCSSFLLSLWSAHGLSRSPSCIAPTSSEPWGGFSGLRALPPHLWVALNSHFFKEGYTVPGLGHFSPKLFISYSF